MKAQLLGLLCALSIGGIAAGSEASRLYKEGREAEQAGDPSRAYVLYWEAAALEPHNQTYWQRSQAVRSQAALLAMPAAGSLAADGPDAGSVRIPRVTSKELADARKPQPPTELDAKRGPVDFDLQGDARTLFQKVAHTYGLDCVFDGDYQAGRAFRFRMEQADYREALRALEAATASFIAPISSKLFLVAKDNPTKRREVEPYASVTLEVPQSTSPKELTEVVHVVQQATGIEKVGFDSQSNMVVLRGPISKIQPARQLFEDLIHHQPQVAIELKFIEVTKSDMLTYGLSPPNRLPISQIANTAATLANISRWVGSGMLGLGIASASMMARLNQSDSRTLFHAELRSVDNQPATLHVGDKYPIMTAAYAGGTTTGGVATSGTTPTSTTPGGGTPTATISSFGSVTQPYGVATADFNADGIPDFAAAGSGENDVAVYLGKGAGTFSDPVKVTAGTTPVAVAAADVNADGVEDLVVANAGSNNVSVLLGKGDGTFPTVNTYAAGTTPAAVAVADFNGDGYPDIAVANSGSGTVSILLGNGDGTFQSALKVTVGASPRSLAVADFNQDGIKDLAVTNYGDNTVSILLGKGDGTFRLAATYATGKGPLGVAADTLDVENTFNDLVVANSIDNTVSVFVGDGNGVFTLASTPAVGATPYAVATGDFNEDGVKDVAVANSGDGTVSMLLGTGAGMYQIAIEFSVGSGTAPRSLVRADFNQDGLADLLASNYGANDFSLLLGSGNGAFHDSSGTSYSYSGGSSYSPAPSFTFEDLGLSLKITPHIHGTDEVTLDLETEFELLAGTSLNGMPVISNRKLASSVRVRNDEWAFVGGLLNTDEARSISGIAGLSALPAIGALMRQVTHNRDSSEVLIMLRTILIDAPPDPSATHTVRVGSETRPLTPM